MKNLLSTNGKACATNTGHYQNYFAGSKNQGFDANKYSQKRYFGQKCSACQTDDLKFAVENSERVFCRRCDQRIEFVRREHPRVITQVAREKAIERQI